MHYNNFGLNSLRWALLKIRNQILIGETGYNYKNAGSLRNTRTRTYHCHSKILESTVYEVLGGVRIQPHASADLLPGCKFQVKGKR